MTQLNIQQPTKAKGWGTGFGNLFRQESKKWWGTTLWLKHAIVWSLIINVFPVMIYFDREDIGRSEIIDLFLVIAMMTTVMGVVIVMQGVIIGEKQSGVTAWLVSKPIARPAYILSRLIATSLAAIVTMLVIPALVSYGLIWQIGGEMAAIDLFAAAIGLVALFMFFLLTLTLMLGTLFNGRSFVIGVPLALVFMADFYQPMISRFAPDLLYYDPMYLLEIAGEVGAGQAITTPETIISTAVCAIAFIIIAISRFNREEF